MPGSVKEIVDAYTSGRSHYRTWRKVPTQTTASGIWFDMSMSPGNPVAQYYVGTQLVATALARLTDGGLDHGPNVSPLVKYLHKFLALTTLSTAAPLPIILCDYLMFYPFVAMDAGQQDLTTVIALPRYPTGAGVQMMAVEVFAQSAGSTTFFVTYTNQDGTAGRTSATVKCNTQVATGTIITSAPTTLGCAGPFIPLQYGDTGVRSIQSITFLSGDTGVIALVLVKPLASHSLFDTTAPVEADWLIDRNILPVIKDDAYLNFICHPVGTLAAGVFLGELHTFWST